MSDATARMREEFGVGTILGDTFGLVFRHIAPMLLIGAVPAIIGAVLNLLAYGPSGLNILLAIIDPGTVAAAGGPGAMAVFLIFLAGMALWGFACAALTRAAWDATTRGSVNVRGALSTGLARLVPMTLCTIVAVIAIYLGAIVLVVPGLWLSGLWIALLPAIVVEGLGSGAFRRSAELTRGYRWPAVGLLVLFMLVTVVLGLLAATLQSAAYFAGTAGMVLGTTVSVVTGAIYYALCSALTTLAYARLREIKEGGGGTVAEVFS